MDEVKELAESLKAHIAENDGELAYWGEKIVPHKSSSPNVSVGDPKNLVHKLDSRLRGNDESGTRHQALPKNEALKILQNETIGDCHLCPLGDTRIKLVFGVGNPETEVMFVGEGPGYAEDRKGEPFVGKAGQLLDKILAAIGLDRTKIYIANIVKCHPMTDPTEPEKRGNDRAPQPSEIEKCKPFLLEQIRIIQPKIIVTLGAVATKALLDRTESITSMRGRLFDFSIDGLAAPIKILPTYHPAALLRDETLKKAVWEDMKHLRRLLSRE